MTPLHRIIQRGDVEAVQLLINAGANVVDSPNRHVPGPLLIAAGESHVGIVRLLLASGANAHETDRESRNALDYALRGRHPSVELVRMLASAGAYRPGTARWTDVFFGDAERGVLEWLIYNSDLDPLVAAPNFASIFLCPALAVLLRFGLDPNVRSSRGVALATLVAKEYSMEQFLYLIMAGLDLDAPSGHGAPSFRAIAERMWPAVAWDRGAPRTVIRQRCVKLYKEASRKSLIRSRPDSALLNDLLLHKIP